MKSKFRFSSSRYTSRLIPLATICLAFSGTGSSVQAATIKLSATSAGTVNYNAGTTWDGGVVPGAADDVVIDYSTGSTATAINIATSGQQYANSITFGSGAGVPLGDFTLKGGSSGTANRRILITTGNITVDPSVTGTIMLGRVPGGAPDTNAYLDSAAAGITLTNNNLTSTLYNQIRWQPGKDLTLKSAGGKIVIDTDAPGWTAPSFASLNGGNSATSFTNSAGTGLKTLLLNGTGAHSFGGRIEDTSAGFSTAQIALNINGAGLTQTLTGASTFTGGTTVSVGTLVAGSSAALGAGSVNVAAGAGLLYKPTTDVSLEIPGNLTVTGAANTVLGGSVGSSAASAQINVAGTATITDGPHTIAVNGVPGIPHATGLVTLIHGGAGSSLNPATVPTVTVSNNTDFTVGALTRTATDIQVMITASTALTTAYWNGNLANGVWSASSGSNSNWSENAGGAAQGLIPGPDANVIFSATAPVSPPVGTVLGQNMSIKGLTISDTVNGLGLNADGRTLTLGTGGITMDAGVPASTIAAKVALGASQTWSIASANPLTVSGVVSEISAGLGLTKSGTGKIVLTAANTYSGTTTISGGTLQLGDGNTGMDGSVTNSTSIVNNGVLAYNRFGSSAYSGNISGTGSVSKSGAGTQILTGSNSYGGTTTIEAGTLRFGKVASLYNGNPASWTAANINVKSGARLFVNLGGTGEFDTSTITTLLANLADSSSATSGMNGGSVFGFDTTNATSEITLSAALNDTTGAAGGSRGFAKSGAGTLILNGTNNYTGTTTVSGGTLKFAKSASLYGGNPASWTPENINVKAGAIFAVNVGGPGEFTATEISTLLTNLDNTNSDTTGTIPGSSVGFDTTNAGGNFTIDDFIYDPQGGGARGLIKFGTGTLTLTKSSLYTGPTRIDAGTLQVGDGTEPGDGLISSGTIINNGSLVYNRFGTATYGGSISGSGSVTKTGPGTQTLSGTSTYTGVTNVLNGTLVAGIGPGTGAAFRGTSSINVSPGATLEIAGTNLFVAGHGFALNDSIVITVNAATLLMTENTDTRFGNITLNNGSTWTSNRTLNAYDALLADTTAGPATVSVTGTGAATMNGSGGIHLQGVQNFNVEDTTGSPAVDLDVSMILGTTGTIGGAAGGIHKIGAGTMRLGAANAYAGETIIDAGRLDLTGSITSPVTVYAPGTFSGSGTVTGNVQVVSGGHFASQIAATPGSHIALLVVGSLTLDSGNIIDLTAATPPSPGVYTLAFTSAGVTYTPGTVNLNGVTGTVSVSGNSLILTVPGGASAYDNFASSKGLTSANNGGTDDPDFDGIENQLEFVLGGNPLASDSPSILPVLTTDANSFIFTFNRADESEAEVALTFEYSSNLTAWTDIAVGAASAGQVTIAENGGAPDTVVVTIPKSNAVGGKLFGRLKSLK